MKCRGKIIFGVIGLLLRLCKNGAISRNNRKGVNLLSICFRLGVRAKTNFFIDKDRGFLDE
jgi:hypothetical protein